LYILFQKKINENVAEIAGILIAVIAERHLQYVATDVMLPYALIVCFLVLSMLVAIWPFA